MATDGIPSTYPSSFPWTAKARAWVIWIVAATFYSFEFFQRVSPSVMINDLMQSFAVSAEQVGILGALYFYAYAITQIPVGMLLDKYGPRLLLTLAALGVAIGSWLFAAATQFWMVEVARIIIGIGSAFAFIGCLTLAAAWFPADRFALVVGLTNMLGVIGALAGEAPLAEFVHYLDWRAAMHIAGLVGIALSLVIWLIVRDRPSYSPVPVHYELKKKPHTLWYGLKLMITTPQSWLIALYAGLMVAPIIAFAELWAVPFLKNLYAIDKATAAEMVSLVFVGIATGGPFNGWLSGKVHYRKKIMYAGNILAIVVLMAIIFLPHLSIFIRSLLLFCLGFTVSSMLLAFPLNCEIQSPDISGTAIAFTNMVIMFIGAVFQPMIGKILDKDWMGNLINGAQAFNYQDYRIALSVLPVCLLISLLIIFFINENERVFQRDNKQNL